MPNWHLKRQAPGFQRLSAWEKPSLGGVGNKNFFIQLEHPKDLRNDQITLHKASDQVIGEFPGDAMKLILQRRIGICHHGIKSGALLTENI